MERPLNTVQTLGLQEQVDALVKELNLVRQKSGQSSGLVTLLRQKYKDANEELFELRANVATIEAEACYREKKSTEVSAKAVTTLQSELRFVNQQLQQTLRTKQRTLKELETLQQQAQVASNRYQAEKRLAESKQRKQHQHFLASQQVSTVSDCPTVGSPWEKKPTSRPAIPEQAQTLVAENAWLVSELMDTALAQDVLELCQGHASAKETQDEKKVLSLRLYEAFSRMLTGHMTAVVLFPILADCFTARREELSPTFLTSALQFLLTLMVKNVQSRRFLVHGQRWTMKHRQNKRRRDEGESREGAVLAENFQREHPRLAFPPMEGKSIRSFDEIIQDLERHESHGANDTPPRERHKEEPDVALEEIPRQLLQGVCRVLRNHLAHREMIDVGLTMLRFWSSVSTAERTDTDDNEFFFFFEDLVTDRVLPEILFGPKSSLDNQHQALVLLTTVLQHSTAMFHHIKTLSSQTCLLNRIAKMLLKTETTPMLQWSIVSLFATIASTYSIAGIQCILNQTRGRVGEKEGEQSILHFLVRFIERESKSSRVTGHTPAPTVKQVLCPSFELLHLLAHFINVAQEMKHDQSLHEHLRCILYWIQTGSLDPMPGELSFEVSSHALKSTSARNLLLLLYPTEPPVTTTASKDPLELA